MNESQQEIQTPEPRGQVISVEDSKKFSEEVNQRLGKDSYFQERKRVREIQSEEILKALQEGKLTQEETIEILASHLAEKDLNEGKDPLMDIYNKRALTQRLKETVAHAIRTGEPVTVVFMDLDKFKDVNDKCGHVTGDIVLSAWASYLKNETRESDVLGRYGGEEVVAILPNTTEETGIQLIGRILAGMPENLGDLLKDLNLPVPLTMSIGIAQMEPEEYKELTKDICQKLVAVADRRMYLAKNNGRNRVYDSKLEQQKIKEAENV